VATEQIAPGRLAGRFESSLDEGTPGLVELRLVGELDRSDSAALGQDLRNAAAGECHVLLDLSACEFIDSAALATILGSHIALAEKGLRLRGFGARGQVRRLIELTDLSGVLSIAQERGEAVSRLLEDGAPTLRPASSDTPTP
jgi:anti-anti-sigma factor